MSIDVIDDNDDTRSINSTSSSDFAANMLNVADPFDAGDPDTRVQRYASLKDFDFLPRELQIITDGGPGCGGHIWQSAVVLSRYLQTVARRDPSRWQNKTAIELGAGTGIVACALATLDIPGLKIWSTDLEQLLPLARANVALNELEHSVFVEELCWGKPLPNDVPHRPDLLLLADCIYLEITFPWLIQTMLMLSTAATEILLCYKKRRKADKRFFVLAKKHFVFEHVLDDPDKHSYDREGLSLYTVRRRRSSHTALP